MTVLASTVTATARDVRVRLRLRQPAGVDPPVARTARLSLPPGIVWRGGVAPSCTAAALADGGVRACPPGSTIGTGTAIGSADTSKTFGRITIVNGGRRHVLLATVVRHPAYVKTVVSGAIRGEPADGLRIDLTFPPDLQTIAGVPVGLQQLQLSIHRGRALRLGSCPSARTWRYRASVAFADGTDAQHAGAVTCGR